MLINLRGTSGSGKTTIVRRLLHQWGARPIFGLLGLRAPEAYRLDHDTSVFVLGPYVSPCGGCDAIGSMDDVLSLLDKYSKRGHVVFESLLVSSMYGSVGEFLERYGKDAIVAFLDTPLERCRQQLLKRQANGRARGDATLAQHYFGTLRVKQRMLDDGILRVEDLDPDRAVQQIEQWLCRSADDAFRSICDFGAQLIATGDLDPSYCAIVGARIEGDQLARLLIAYWLFYHLGLAGWLSDQSESDFWDAALAAARNETASPIGGRWPRGSERRHFRGQKAIDAIETLRRYRPAAMLAKLTAAHELDAIVATVTEWPMFGPWIAFKAADMVERVAGSSVAFSRDVCLLYKEPRAGLELIAQRMGWSPTQALAQLEDHFQHVLAPPSHDRPCGIQEIETVLCKFKGSLAGSYWIGKDIHEVRKALEGWGATAAEMLTAMPQQTNNNR
jgi:hypothetical protein